MDPFRDAPRLLALSMTLRLDQLLDPASYVFAWSAVPPLLVMLLVAILGCSVLVRERGSFTSVTFSLLAFVGSLWLGSYVGIYTARYDAVALWWAKIENVAVAFIPTLVYLFTLAVVQRLREFRSAIWGCVTCSTIFAWGILTTDGFVAGLYRYPWGAFARYGPLSWPFLIGFLGLMGASLRLFAVACARARSHAARRRFQLLLYAFGVGSLASVDYLPAFGLPVYPAGYVPVCIFLVITAYVIWRYRLVDINPAFAAHQVMTTMADALVVVDCEGMIRMVNEAACRLFEHPKGELIGHHISTIHRRFFGSRGVTAVIRSGVVERYEAEYPTKDRGTVSLDISLSTICDRTGQPVGIVCIARDLTERKRAERTIQESRAYAESIVDTIREPLVVLDATLRIKAANRAFYDMFQTSPESSRNQRIDQLGPGRWNLSKLRGMLKLLPNDSPFEGVEIEYEFPGEGIRTLLLNARRLRRNGNQTDLILLAMEDITERRRVEAQLRAAIAELEASREPPPKSQPPTI